MLSTLGHCSLKMTIIVGHGTWDCKISSQDAYCHNCERHHCRQHHRCTSVIMVWSPPGPPRTGHSTLVCCPLCLILEPLVNCGGSTCDLCLMLECVITSLCDPTTRLLTLNGSASEVWARSTIGSMNFGTDTTVNAVGGRRSETSARIHNDHITFFYVTNAESICANGKSSHGNRVTWITLNASLWRSIHTLVNMQAELPHIKAFLHVPLREVTFSTNADLTHTIVWRALNHRCYISDFMAY